MRASSLPVLGLLLQSLPAVLHLAAVPLLLLALLVVVGTETSVAGGRPMEHRLLHVLSGGRTNWIPNQRREHGGSKTRAVMRTAGFRPPTAGYAAETRFVRFRVLSPKLKARGQVALTR